MNASRRPWRSRYTAVILTAVVGTLVTIGAFLLVCSWEYRVAAIDFQSKATSYLEFINADLGDASTLMYNIAAFIGSDSHPVSANEFAQFSAASHRRVSGLRDTAWAPRVTLAERPKFERDARAAGMAGYQIRQLDPHHKLIRAAPRPEYYPLLYLEAGGVKRAMLGIDLIGEKLRARAALRALQTGRPAATPPTDVLTVKQRGAGVLSYMPVYRPGNGNGTRRHLARGLVLGVFDIPAIVGNILAHHTTVNGLNLYLFNPTARSDRRVIYRTPLSAVSGPPLSEAALIAGAHWQSTVLLIDQHIGAIVTPAQPLHVVRWSLFGITTLIVGSMMTAMSVAYLLMSLRRTLQLEALTTSLQATTVTLHESAEQITKMSRHDALTGMPNRLLFRERMDQAVVRFRRDAPFALLFLDLDRFKAVNDTLGHGAGDRLLCAVAERIAGCVREVDTAARLGGDEFAIILDGAVDSATVSMVANRLIASISRPYTIDDQPVAIGVSVGGAIAVQDVTAVSIVAEADLAMYAVKAAGRGTFRLFEPRLRARADEKRLLENDLRRGLEHNELEVHYQPLVDLAQHRVSSFEALVRWRHPERGLIPANRFIPVAEECGLIGQLGLWVLRTACEDAAGWPQPVKVAVNISPLQFTDAALLSNILQCLVTSGLPPGRLEIEITEAAVLQHSETTLALLTQLRAVGVAVAFDDFGTGYSSLSSLLRFPFDKIKIDRSFLEHVETSPSAAAIVRAVVGLGANLNLTTTGEGVETLQQLEHLRSCGCSEAQGYLFSPARPNVEVPHLLQALDARTGTGFDTVRA
jgi:diguanylate cyclase (GGDEF)-like protein